MSGIVIVGASLAGAKAAETLRAEGYSGQISLVGEETDRPYERPPLSKGYLTGKDPRDKAFVHPQGWAGSANIELLLGVRATMLDPAAHVVTLDGFDPVHYDKLLLATGSRPRRLDAPGWDLTGVRYLRTLVDADNLLDRLHSGASVVVIGAGWIGLETAAAAIERGATVHVVEMDTLPLRRVLGDEVAEVFRRTHEAHGVTFHFSTGVEEFIGTGGVLTAVRLTDGTELPATVAVIGVGVQPNVELGGVGGLQIDNGIVTDQALRTSAPDVFACGDVASSYHPLIGSHIRVEHWSNALNGGPAAARSMLGQDVVYDQVPYFFTDQYDLGMEYGGYVTPGGYDEVVFRGDPAGAEFIAFWTAGGRVLAGMNVNVWDVQDDIQKLVRAGYAGQAVDLAALADAGSPLADLIA